MIPLLFPATVLWTSYSALTSPRFPSANALTGGLLPGQSIGQSFVARYPNLSAVELRLGVASPPSSEVPASLVFHLRDALTPGRDLATGQLDAGSPFESGSWYRFTFPPIADSQGRFFYFEVESPDGAGGKALSVFWWKWAGGGDPYPDGSAYRDREPMGGDLSFGLGYSPSPLDVVAQVAPSLGSQALPALSTLLVLLVACGGLAWRKRFQLLRLSLPLALGVALVNGLFYILLVPPWQGPDEPAHFGYAAILERNGLDNGTLRPIKQRDTALIATVSASMSRADFTRYLLGNPQPGAPTNVADGVYGEWAQPPAYYWLCAAAIHSGKGLGLPVDPYVEPENALRVMRGVSLILSLGVVALAWLAGVLLSGRRYPWLRLLLPLTVALLPMHAFISSIANNDILAELSVSTLFVTLIALLRRPTGRAAAALAALAVLITLASLFTKKTAPLASLPLLALGLAFWAAMLLSRLSARRVRAAIAGILLLALLGVVPLAFAPQAHAVNWEVGLPDNPPQPIVPLPQVRMASAHDGHYVLELGPDTAHAQVAEQVLLPAAAHPGFTLTVSGWARTDVPNEQATVHLALTESDTRIGRQVMALDRSGAWTPFSVKGRVTASEDQVVVLLKSPEATVQFDDLSAGMTEIDGAGDAAIPNLRVLNPSFEDAALELRPQIAAILPSDIRMIAEVLVNPQPFDKLALWQHYAYDLDRSFWGNFGWGAVQLPDGLYRAIDLALVVALIGLLRGVLRRRWTWREWVGLLALLSLAAALFFEFSSEMMLFIIRNNRASPQGRYLFVLIIPIIWLLLEGLGESWSLFASGVARLAIRLGMAPTAETVAAKRPLGSWAGWLWLNALLAFAAYCLLSLIIPFYWG